KVGGFLNDQVKDITDSQIVKEVNSPVENMTEVDELVLVKKGAGGQVHEVKGITPFAAPFHPRGRRREPKVSDFALQPEVGEKTKPGQRMRIADDRVKAESQQHTTDRPHE